MKDGTRKRIEAYQNALPFAKQKISMVAMILIIAVIISVTATYAWITLSYAPEVTGLQATMASNGSLEIGLAASDGSQPVEFDIDESVGFRTDVVTANRRWGNLINLMDDSYGMQNIELRPARLSESTISIRPLEGVQYKGDGRIDGMISKFTYTKYDAETGEFAVNLNERGVRAISSYAETKSEATSNKELEVKQAMTNAMNQVGVAYSKVEDSFGGLTNLLSAFAQDKVNATDYAVNAGTKTAFTVEYMNGMLTLYGYLYDAMKLQRDVYVSVANCQRFLEYGRDYVPLTWTDIYNSRTRYNVASSANSSTDGIVKLVGLTQFCTDLDKVETHIDKMKTYKTRISNGEKIYWDEGGDSGYQINQMIYELIEYSTMRIQKEGSSSDFPVSEISSHAMEFMGTNTATATIVGGIMKRFEQLAVKTGRLSGNKKVMTIQFKAKKFITLTVTINCKVKTNATTPCYMDDFIESIKGVSAPSKDAIAQDTYGLAVDFWVRCNAESTLLMLEGATARDADGNILKFDGVNRVWGPTGNAVLTTDSTTQGGGSCYVFYPKDPQEMYNTLSLMESIKVAFVQTSTGHLLSEAKMDKDNFYELDGHVTVPLIIDTNRGDQLAFEEMQEDGSTLRLGAIADLRMDVPQDITAIVYLDGDRITNSDVMATGTVDGQLNIQFGSSESLTTVGDEELLLAERSVRATVSKTELDYDDAVMNSTTPENPDIQYNSPAFIQRMTTSVTLKIKGTIPSRKVESFFVKKVSDREGQKEGTLEFVKVNMVDDDADAVYTCDYTFRYPGVYYLRYVKIDGVDYKIDNPCQVVVKGFTVRSVSWKYGSALSKMLFTLDNSIQEKFTVTYSTSDERLMPKRVQAVLRNVEDPTTQVVANLTLGNNNAWSGSATFTNSGTYILTALVEDGRWRGLTEAEFRKELTLYLGLRTTVYDNSGRLTEPYDAGHGMYYRDVAVEILDNAGNKLPKQDNVRLYYNGKSADTNLTWDEDNHRYTGTLQLSEAGRYTFRCVTIGADVLTQATAAPVYVLRLSNPPTYDINVDSDYGNRTVQFSPGTNDAYIGPIGFKYSSSSSVSAVVYNSVTKDTYDIIQASEGATEPGCMYYSNAKGGWIINLPVYSTGEGINSKMTQAGQWDVKAIRMWDCIDEDENERDEEHPLVFASSDVPDNLIGSGTKLVTDFSKHSTTVSCTVKIGMNGGSLDVGNSTVSFMSPQKLSSTGMYVTITDDANRSIPASKVASGVDGYSVRMRLSYDSTNQDTTAYGYKVEGMKISVIELTFTQAADGNWYVDGSMEPAVRYVGQYTVTGVTVVMRSGEEYALAPGEGGVPTAYSVRSGGPRGNDYVVKLENGIQTNFEGSFLGTVQPNTRATVALHYRDETTGEYVEETHVSVGTVYPKLVLTYDRTKSADEAYSGFTYGGSGSYETVQLDMTRTGSNTFYSVSGSSPLVPGVYTQKVVLDGVDYNQLSSGHPVSDISVKFNKPAAKITGVTPTDASMNAVTSGAGVYTFAQANLMTVTNSFSDTSAQVFAGAAKKSFGALEGVGYTMPQVSITLSNLGSFDHATLTFPNETSSGDPTVFNFRSGSAVQTTAIGKVKTETVSVSGTNYSVEIPYVIGKQTVDKLYVYDPAGAAYVVDLAAPVTINQPKTPPASISFKNSDVDGIVVPGMVSSANGERFRIVLPATAAEGAGLGYTDSGSWVFTKKYDKNDAAGKPVVEAQETADKIVENGRADSRNGSATQYVYYSDGSATSEKTGCNSYTTTWTGTVTQFTITPCRTEYECTIIQEYTSVTRGIVAWEINGERIDVWDTANNRAVDASQRTIWVEGPIVAKPIVDVVAKAPNGDAKVQTNYKTYSYYTINVDKSISGTANGNNNGSAARTNAINSNNYSGTEATAAKTQEAKDRRSYNSATNYCPTPTKEWQEQVRPS